MANLSTLRKTALTVYTTGNQEISGLKNFSTRPTVNNTGILLNGEINTYNAAVEWTANHTLVDGTRYLAGDLVYVSGKIYKANFDNESIPVTDTLYWTDLGIGYRLNIDGRDIPNIPVSPAIQTGLDSKYDASNPSGFITGVDLSNYATASNLQSTGQTLQNQINNLDNTYASDTALLGTGQSLDNKINNLSGVSVLTYGEQYVNGRKIFRDQVIIQDLYVTGTETIVNTTNTNVGSNYILLNATGGAIDAGIFIVTGSGLTGITDTGAVIGYDVPANRWVFGNTSRDSDLSQLEKIAGITDITNYSGYASNTFATITNLETTGSNLNQKIDDLSGVSVLIYGDQTINGLKDFATRPTVNTVPVLLSGEVNTAISGVFYTAEVNIKNNNGSTIYKGQPVYVSSAAGSNILVKLASNTGEATSSKTFGLVNQSSLAQNAQGTVVTEGLLQGFNTSAAGNEGDPIWLGPTGNLIFGLANKPKAPNHLVYLGVVTRKHAIQGEIFVHIQNGFEVRELHDARIINEQNSDIIIYNSGSGLWLNSGVDFGSFYTNKNPSGFITSRNVVYTTGNQTISGIKYFSNDTVFKNNILYISEPSGQISGSGYTGYYDGGQFLGKLKLTQNNTKINNIGNNWVFAARGYQFLYTAKIAISSDGKYQSISDDATTKIIVSDDYGKSWKYRGSGMQYSEIAMSSDGKYQIAGGIYRKLYSSNDYGNTWNVINNTPIRFWRSVAISSNGQYQSACVNQGTDFIYVSNDYGNTWATKATQGQWDSISMSSDGKYQTVISAGSSVLISNDYGNTWVQSLGVFNYLQAVAVSSNGQFQTVAALEGLFISNNYGKDWLLVEPMQYWRSISMSSDGKIQAAIGNNNQIYISNNYGYNWNLKNSTLACQNIGMSADAKYLTAINNSTIFTSISDEMIDGNFTASNIYGNNLVYKTGDQSILDNKTFSGSYIDGNFTLRSQINTNITQFGTSAALNQDSSIMAVGANNSVILYTGKNNTYVQKQTLFSDGGNDFFGCSVSFNASGDVLVVGAQYDSSFKGAAFIFTGSAASQYVSVAKLTGRLGGDNYGQSACITENGDTIFVGSLGDDTSGFNNGAVYIYTGSKQNGWQFKQSIIGTGASTLGVSVACNKDGSVLVVGADRDPAFNRPLASENGAANIYTGSKDTQWSFVTKISGANTGDQAFYGNSVSIDREGSTILINGISSFNISPASAIYTGSINNGWSFFKSLQNPFSGTTSSSISSDGQYIASVAASQTPGTSTIFVHEKLDNWSSPKSIFAGNSTDGHKILAFAEENNLKKIIAGAPYFGPSDLGRAYIFSQSNVANIFSVNSNNRDFVNLTGNCNINGQTNISGNARIIGDISASGNVNITGNLTLSTKPTINNTGIFLMQGEAAPVVHTHSTTDVSLLDKELGERARIQDVIDAKIDVNNIITPNNTGVAIVQFGQYGSALGNYDVNGVYYPSGQSNGKPQYWKITNNSAFVIRNAGMFPVAWEILHTTLNPNTSIYRTIGTPDLPFGLEWRSTNASDKETVQVLMSGAPISETYATVNNLALTGSINATNLATTGSALQSQINNLEPSILTLGSANHNPASGTATNYYIAQIYDLASVTSTAAREFRVPFSGKIVGAVGTVNVGGTTSTSTASATFSLYNKNTTSSQNLITTGLLFNATNTTTGVNNLNIDILPETPYLIQITTPGFVGFSAPTTVRYSCSLWIK